MKNKEAILKNALIFMERVNLSGSEVPAFNIVVDYLNEEIERTIKEKEEE